MELYHSTGQRVGGRFGANCFLSIAQIGDTVNEVVDVTFPTNFIANVKLSSTFGDIFTDFDKTPDTKIKTNSDKEKGKNSNS